MAQQQEQSQSVDVQVGLGSEVDRNAVDLSSGSSSAAEFDPAEMADSEFDRSQQASDSFEDSLADFDRDAATTTAQRQRENASAAPAADGGEVDLSNLSPADRKRAQHLLNEIESTYQAEEKARINLAQKLSKMKRPQARASAIRNAQKASLGRGEKVERLQEQLAGIVGDDQVDGLNNNQPEFDLDQDQEKDQEKRENEPDNKKRQEPEREQERREQREPDQDEQRRDNERDSEVNRLTPQQEKRLRDLQSQIDRLEDKDRRAEQNYEKTRERYLSNGKVRAAQVLEAKFKRADAGREQRLADLRSEAQELRDLKEGNNRPEPRDDRNEREEERREQERRDQERRDSERRDQERRDAERRREEERREQERPEPEQERDSLKLDTATERRLNNRTRTMLRSAREGQLPEEDLKRLQELLSDKSFQTLNALEKSQVLNLYSANQGNAGQLEAIKDVATGDYFARYSTSQQSAALELFQGRDMSWLGEVSPSWQQAICNQMAGSGSIAKAQTLAMLDSGGFEDLAQDDARNGSNSNKLKLMNIVFNSSAEGQKELLRALEKDAGSPPKTILLDKDSEGDTLLENAHELAVAKKMASPKLVKERKELLRSMLEAVADAGEVNQGGKGTCAATDPLWRFTQTDPGEVSRLFSELVIDGKSDFRREGRTAVLEPESYKPGVNWNTTLYDQIMSASFMEHANGDNLDYRYTTDNHLKQGTNTEEQDGGLYQHQQRRLLESFYDRDFETHHVSSDGLEDLMKELNTNLEHGSVHSVLRWQDADRTTIGKEKHSYHAVSVVGIKEDENGVKRVYIRNPWGESSKANGTEIRDDGPARRMEDRDNGVESMTLAEFRRRITSFNVPKSTEGWSFF